MLTKANPSSRDKGAAAQLHPPTLCKIPGISRGQASSYFGFDGAVFHDDFGFNNPKITPRVQEFQPPVAQEIS